jgi:hypothetical protein
MIARAIAALPYSRPRPGFSARVMARIAVAPAAAPWQERLLEQAGLLVAGWGGMLAFLGARFLWRHSADVAETLLRPGGPTVALNLAGAHAALYANKLASAVYYAAGFLPRLPGWHETAIATFASALIIAALARGERAAKAHI